MKHTLNIALHVLLGILAAIALVANHASVPAAFGTAFPVTTLTLAVAFLIAAVIANTCKLVSLGRLLESAIMYLALETAWRIIAHFGTVISASKADLGALIALGVTVLLAVITGQMRGFKTRDLLPSRARKA